jgi:hypothetical protein
LFSPSLLLDGDECIVGLMAKHIAEGRELPIFLYGQSYGLSLIEAPAAALNFAIFGTGVLPLKLSLLALWIAGVLFYFLAFAQVMGNTRSFWLTLLLVLMPAWAVSSMKAWSGYVTAFSAAAVLLYVLMRKARRPSVSWVMAGWLSSIIYLAQPLWLPGLLPVLLFFLLSSRRLRFAFLYLSGIGSMLLSIELIQWLSRASVVESWRPPRIGNRDLIGSVPGVAEQIYVNLTGSYYLWFSVDPGTVTAILAYLWLAVLAAALPVQIYRVVCRRYLLWSHLLFISAVSTLLANWVLLEARDGRYLLPLSVPLVFMAGFELFDLADRRRLSDRKCVALIVCALLVGAVSMNEFGRFSYMWWKNPRNSLSEAARIEALIDYLKANRVRHAFSMNALLQWQIMFYSREAIVARWTAETDRYPAYVREVDRALGNGERVALVGYVGFTGGLENMVHNPQAIFDVDNRYFAYIGPDKELLEKARFRFVN